MSDYSSVAPPQSNQAQAQYNTSSAFAAALQRAKQIAAKIQPGGGAGQQQQPQQGIKRGIDDASGEPDNKKFNTGSDYGSPNSSSMSPATMQAVAQAAAIAARINNSSNAINEEVKLPEQMIGLLSARGSDDQLGRLQSESNCKVQLRDGGMCVLNGTRDAVGRAKDMLNKLCVQHNCGSLESQGCVSVPPSGAGGYPPYQEVMVPGSKVGLVIGKGGETIKMLQEKTGAKMVIIQDGPGQELTEKPLRISGDPQKVEHAKQLVFDLILEKDNYSNRGGGGGGGGGYSNGGGLGAGGDQAEVFVPKNAVGVVIGKGGDMIKKIQGETGCKLQFVQGKNDGPGDRRCIISGNKSQVEDAKRTIEDLIESVMRSNNGMNRNNNMPQANSNYGYGDMSQQPMREEVSFTVPASKCGIVIGRGGETIKLINQQSGAFCEMDRSAINPPSEKMFKMKGTTEQIEHARQMISEKIGVDIKILSTRQIGAGNGSGGGGGGGGYGQGGGGGGGQSQGMQSGGAGGYQQQWGGYQQPQWDQAQQQPQPVQINPSTGQPDYSAQWIEYYKSIGHHREAEIIEQQLKVKQGAAGGAPGGVNPMVSAATAAANGGGVQTPTMVQAGQMQAAAAAAAQQPDYSAQWAEYYRSIGKNDEAEAIEKQIQVTKGNQGQMQPAAPAFAAVPGGHQANMAAYNQYSQYYGQQQQGYAQAAYGAYGGYPQPQQPQQPGGPPQQPGGGPPGPQGDKN